MRFDEIRLKTEPIFRKYHVRFAGLFGSHARGQADSDSDVDFLVAFEKTPSLVRFIRLENELQETLQADVDLVVSGSEKPLIKPQIYRDLIPVYGQRPSV